MRRALILAAGKGTRMKTEIPKCAYPILNKPMILYQVEALERANVDDIIVIVGYKSDVIKKILGSRVNFVYQKEILGTAHAVIQAKKLLEDKTDQTIILPGDLPLVNATLIDKIFRGHTEMGNELTVVSTIQENSKGYGKILYDEYGNISQIIEDKDCNEKQKNIKEVNSGIYIVNNQSFFKHLHKIKRNARSGEYYLTDIVKILQSDTKIGVFKEKNNIEVMGVNNLFQISKAEKYLRREINSSMMKAGVSMINPDTITIGHDVIIEEGVVILPNTTITGNSHIFRDCIIGPNTELNDAIIENECIVKHSLIYDSYISSRSKIGPFSHIRDKSHIGEENRIGNFVEVKKSTTGNNTKASHLSYIGDATIGKKVNFGCGSITVNYDGKYKHNTNIGDEVFIGCNVNLIAPIKVSKKAFIAAGSTVTNDVPEGSLAIAREKQTNKADYVRKK
jgi:bifunctional UDP-N-acetylglucosamine pyrophosphorylase/glucosamine-1-phosphate N-acetyltransferase